MNISLGEPALWVLALQSAMLLTALIIIIGCVRGIRHEEKTDLP